MRYIYSLRIDTDIKYRETINKILDIDCNYFDVSWGLEITQEKEDDYFDFINYFIDLLEFNYSLLEKIGVFKEHISIWLIYEYNQQCNLEFSPKDLKRLGDEGISLCISCYDAG